MEEVKVFVKSGMVQGVITPKGVKVIIYDYDIESIEKEKLSKDDEGTICIETIYKHMSER